MERVDNQRYEFEFVYYVALISELQNLTLYTTYKLLLRNKVAHISPLNIQCRYSLRRQSTGLKDEKPEPTEDSVEVVEVKKDISKANESGTTSLESKVHDEAREATECNFTQLVHFLTFVQSCYIEPYAYSLHAASRPTNTEPVHAKKNIENKR